MTKNPSLRMRRNCNLELRLSPTSDHPSTAISTAANGSPQRQQLTIFYDGQICVRDDVTEIEAIAIFKLATKAMDAAAALNEPKSPILQPSHVPRTPITPGLSMKKSLQKFLQKRKHRIQSTSPYNH